MALGLFEWAAEDWVRLCWVPEEIPAVERCGFVNSSKRSASRGWCMCRWVTEESLLWGVLVSLEARYLVGEGLICTILTFESDY